MGVYCLREEINKRKNVISKRKNMFIGFDVRKKWKEDKWFEYSK